MVTRSRPCSAMRRRGDFAGTCLSNAMLAQWTQSQSAPESIASVLLPNPPQQAKTRVFKRAVRLHNRAERGPAFGPEEYD